MTTRHITAGLIATVLLTGCHNLDFDETNGLNTRENIYRYFDDTKQMLTNVYSFMPQDFGAVEEAMRSCASDDAEFGNAAAGIQDFNNGNWSAIRTHDTAWSLYKGIRAANEFIESVAKTDFSRFKYDQNYPNWEKQLRYFPYEARALRAFYLFELARRYGDIAFNRRSKYDRQDSFPRSNQLHRVGVRRMLRRRQSARHLPRRTGQRNRTHDPWSRHGS